MIRRITCSVLSLILGTVLCGGPILNAQSPLEPGPLEAESLNGYQILVVGQIGASWIDEGFHQLSHLVAQPPKTSGPPLPSVPSLSKHPRVKMWLWISVGVALVVAGIAFARGFPGAV